MNEKPSKPANHAIARRLRMARAFRNLTLETLAAKSDLTAEALQIYETGNIQVPDELLVKVAQALALNIDYFSSVLPAAPHDGNPHE